MLRLGHYGCQSTTNENGFHGNRPWPGKSYTINSNFFGGGMTSFSKVIWKGLKKAGLQKSLLTKLRCICGQNAWNILVKQLIFGNMTGLMHRTFQKNELFHKWVRLQISDHLVVVTFLQRNSVNDLWQLKLFVTMSIIHIHISVIHIDTYILYIYTHLFPTFCFIKCFLWCVGEKISKSENLLSSSSYENNMLNILH